MLRDSPLEGFGVKNGLEIKRLITTLYTDDTTVFLSERDHLKTLQEIIQKWCKVSGAKFNENKTIILPTGTPEYRARVVATRKHNPNDPIIPENIIIAQDGRPVRILGSFLGNAIEQSGIWTPIIEKIDDQLEKWNRSHPTQEGKRLIINMEVVLRFFLLLCGLHIPLPHDLITCTAALTFSLFLYNNDSSRLVSFRLLLCLTRTDS